MDVKNNFKKLKYHFKRYGFIETIKKVFKRIFHIKENKMTNQEQYEIWMKKKLNLEINLKLVL